MQQIILEFSAREDQRNIVRFVKTGIAREDGHRQGQMGSAREAWPVAATAYELRVAFARQAPSTLSACEGEAGAQLAAWCLGRNA